jgi:hypothetical protein
MAIDNIPTGTYVWAMAERPIREIAAGLCGRAAVRQYPVTVAA